MWKTHSGDAIDLSRSYYVIIGMGFASLVNHLTLLAGGGSGRTGGLPILHIAAEEDPWRFYFPREMGQWPSLLTLPAFAHKPTSPAPQYDYSFLKSDDFAAISDQEWLDLMGRHPFQILPAKAMSFRRTSAGYEIDCTMGGTSGTVLATAIDVCGGPGPARRSLKVTDATLLAEYEDGTGRFWSWPRVATGEMFLQYSTSLANPGCSVAVLGAGPTAAWCVERAEQQGCSVLWAGDKEINGAFISSRRNDSLAQTPLIRNHVGGLHVVTSDLFPSHPSTRFAENVLADRISRLPGGDVELEFIHNPAVVARTRVVDASLAVSAVLPGPEQFQQVVIAMGQVREPHEINSWAQLLDPLLAAARKLRNHLITDRVGRVIGLQDDHQLRVLGAAALSHPEVAAQWRVIGSSSNLFFRSLVEQARVDVGITLSAETIAEANQWPPTGPNDNLNTASLKDLTSVGSSLFAQTWYEMRAARIPPFTTDEISRILGSTKDRY